MPELGASLRDLIDAAAPPVSFEAITSRGRRRRRRHRVAFGATSALLAVIASVAIVAIVARHTSTRGLVASPAMTTVARGHAGSVQWILQARRDDARVTLELRSRAVDARVTGGTPTGQLAVVSVRDRRGPIVYVIGIAPQRSDTVRLSDPTRRSESVAAVGDASRFGARFFVAVRKPTDSAFLRVEALGTEGSVLATEQLVAAFDHEPTKGPVVSPPQGGAVTAADMAEVPDYIPVTGRGTISVAGYMSKCDAGFCPGRFHQPGNTAVSTVCAADLQTVVGHEYSGRGFIPLGTDPAAVSPFPTRCYGSKGEIPCSPLPPPPAP